MHTGPIELEGDMRTKSWFRPARSAPPEVLFLTLVVLLAAGLYALAAPARPVAPTSIVDLAPACADARQPCRGVR